MGRLAVIAVVVFMMTTPGEAAAQSAPDHLVPEEAGALVPLPPRQPTPAGMPHDREYPYPDDPMRYGVEGLGGFTVYEPRDAGGGVPEPRLPVVVLLRGACVGPCDTDRDNDILHPWRDHLVRKGNIVVLPHYQQGDDPEFELANVAVALHLALETLQHPEAVHEHPELPWEGDDRDGDRALDGPHARPDLARVGVAGHSRGSQMAVKLAARIATGQSFGRGVHLPAGATGAQLHLPRPRWLQVVQPGPTSFQDYGDADAIPPDTLVVVVVGEDDTLAGEDKARQIWGALDQVPQGNRDYVRVRSHRRGPWTAGPPAPGCELDPVGEVSEQARWYAAILSCGSNGLAWSRVPKPPGTRNTVGPGSQTGDLTADHYFPGRGDALDVHATWKLAQALAECSGRGHSCEYALGDTPEQRAMGSWSDGEPVHELCVTNTPAEPWQASCGAGSAVDGGPEPVGSPAAAADPEGRASEDGTAGADPDPALPATGGGHMPAALAAVAAAACLAWRPRQRASTCATIDGGDAHG